MTATISKRIALGTAAALGFVLASSPAAAQATRTWISGVGDDVNPCSRTAPCKTFQGAISKTATGGEINCIDGAGFGSVTITKSISLVCDDVENGVLVSGTNGITINNATAYVVLSGFDLEGLGNAPTTAGINGVNVVNATTVVVRNSRIRGFRNGYGIYVQPQSAPVKVFIDGVTVINGGNTGNTSTGGVGIFPAAGQSATVTITNSHILDSVNTGVRADTTGVSGAAVVLKIDGTTIDGNTNGILLKSPAGTGSVRMMLTNSSVSTNGTAGIVANGPGVTGRVGSTQITGNASGVVIAGTATLSSYGTNQLDGNTNDGAFSGTIAPK